MRRARFVSEYDGFTAEVYPRYVEKCGRFMRSILTIFSSKRCDF